MERNGIRDAITVFFIHELNERSLGVNQLGEKTTSYVSIVDTK
jgi:hypothetical protein